MTAPYEIDVGKTHLQLTIEESMGREGAAPQPHQRPDGRGPGI